MMQIRQLPHGTAIASLLFTKCHAFLPHPPSSAGTRKFATMASASNLISIPEAIAAHEESGNTVFIDGSWHMPNTRNAREEFRLGPRIGGARFFDIDDVCAAHPKGLPHMKPTPRQFAIAMDMMKIAPDDTLCVYAGEGCAAAHRAYWTLRSAGHDPSRVKLVQGSLREWKSRGGELDETALDEGDERLFRMPSGWEEMTPEYACREVDNVVDMERVLSIVESKEPDAVIVDARSAGRFYGKDPEPRPGLRGGHMPNALNVPFLSLLNDKDLTKFKPLDEIRQTFIEAGIKPYEESGGINKVVCSCGSGVTAAALAVGLEECGLRRKEDIYLYDGSWIEWGGDETTPILKDEDE